MNTDATSRAATGLLHYVHSVAHGLGEDVLALDVEADQELATAIIVVRSHVPTLDEWTLLLTWDEVNGWALRIKVSDDGDTTVLGYQGREVLPGPHSVRDFLDAAKDDEHPGSVGPPGFRAPNERDDLETRLAEFA